MDKKITSSVVLASFATTQFGLLNVSAEHNNSKEDATNNSKEMGEGNKLQSKLGAQNVEKAKGVEDVEKVEKKMANLERSLESKPATYSKVVGIPVVSTDEKSAASKPADDGTKFKKNRTDVATNGKKPVKKAVKLNKPVPHRGKQEDDVGTFGKLKSYLGNMFNFSGKKNNTIGNKKTENKNLKTGTKKAEVKKSPVTEKGKTAVKVAKYEKPEEKTKTVITPQKSTANETKLTAKNKELEAKTKTVTTPQKAPTVTGAEIKKDLQQDKPFSKKISKGIKLFDFAPSKEAKTFFIGTGMLGVAYATDRLVESLKNTAKKGSFIPEGANSQKTSTDESKKAMPGGEFISEVGGELKDNALSYPIKFILGSDRKIRKSIGDILDSFSKNNVNDLLNCKGEGFNDFSKAVKDFGLGSLSADDLLGKNKKDFLEALKKLSITDKEVDALLSEENIDKFKNTLQQAGLSAEKVEALLGKDLKRFSKLLGNAAIESDGFYAILEKNFGNFEEKIKNASLPLEAIKYIGRLVLSIPGGFLFWPKLTVWLWRKLSESGAGTETKIVAALAFAAFYGYKYIWSFYKIYKAYKEKVKKNKKDQLGLRKFLFTNGDIQKLSYDFWILRHVLRPLLATTFTEESGGDKKVEGKKKNLLDKFGDRLSPLVKPSKVAAGVLWRLTPISVGWGLLTDWLPSLLKGADTLEADAVEEWENTDLGKLEKKDEEEKKKKAEKDKEDKKEKDQKNEEINEKVKAKLDEEEKFIKMFESDLKELNGRHLKLKFSLGFSGATFGNGGKIVKKPDNPTSSVRYQIVAYEEDQNILDSMIALYHGNVKLKEEHRGILLKYLKELHPTDTDFLNYIEKKIKYKEPLNPNDKIEKQKIIGRIKKDIKLEGFDAGIKREKEGIEKRKLNKMEKLFKNREFSTKNYLDNFEAGYNSD